LAVIPAATWRMPHAVASDGLSRDDDFDESLLVLVCTSVME